MLATYVRFFLRSQQLDNQHHFSNNHSAEHLSWIANLSQQAHCIDMVPIGPRSTAALTLVYLSLLILDNVESFFFSPQTRFTSSASKVSSKPIQNGVKRNKASSPLVTGPPLETKPDYENIHGPLGETMDKLFLTVFRSKMAEKVGVDSTLPKVCTKVNYWNVWQEYFTISHDPCFSPFFWLKLGWLSRIDGAHHSIECSLQQSNSGAKNCSRRPSYVPTDLFFPYGLAFMSYLGWLNW